MRHAMKVAAVMSVAALTLAACGDSGDDPGTSGSSSSTTKKSDIKVGMAYDVGGRGDQSFNDSAAAGLDKAKTELGVDTKEAAAVNGENEAAREERLQQLVDAGYTHVVAVGFAYAASVGKAAKDNPDVHFAIVDDASDDSKGANVDQITFAENEGSFLVGAAAALKSKTGHIGFVGGVNVPLIKKFEAGYIAGAKAVNPAIKVDSSTSPSRRTSAASVTRPRARPRRTACTRRAPTWSTTPLVAPVVASSRLPRLRASSRSVSTPTRPSRPGRGGALRHHDLDDQEGRRRGLRLHQVGG